jgi:hypothetical protein
MLAKPLGNLRVPPLHDDVHANLLGLPCYDTRPADLVFDPTSAC